MRDYRKWPGFNTRPSDSRKDAVKTDLAKVCNQGADLRNANGSAARRQAGVGERHGLWGRWYTPPEAAKSDRSELPHSVSQPVGCGSSA